MYVAVGGLLLLAIGVMIGFSFTRLQSIEESGVISTKDKSQYPKPTVIKKVNVASKPIAVYEPAEIESVVDQERTRIKNALHDDTVQRLIAIKIRLESLFAAPKMITEEQGETILVEIERTIISLRFLIANLINEEYEQKTLSELLHSLESRFARFLLMRVLVYEVNQNLAFLLSPKQKSELMLIVQEALQNSIKHSVNNQFHIHLTWQEDKLVLETEDQGWIIDPYATMGLGSKSMQMRADSIGAKFQSRFTSGKGVLVTVELAKNLQNPVAVQKSH
jgi:signal transduction histidine kinase